MKKEKIYNGNIIVIENEILVVDYTLVTGSVDVREGGTLQSDALTTIGGSVDVCTDATLQADALTTIGGYVDVREGGTLQADALTTIGGYVDVIKGGTLQADALTTIGGYVDVREGGTLQADALTAIGGSVDVREGGTLQADALTTIGDSVYVCTDATLQADALTTIGGSVYVRTDATLKADALTTIGGSVYVRKGGTLTAKKYVSNSEDAKEIASKIKRNGWETPDRKYIIADGILTEIVSRKANVWRVRKIARKEIEYLITDGNGNYAHGYTLSAAKEDLLYKVCDRKKSDYEGMKTTDVLSHSDAVKCYRVITGACSAGTRSFVEDKLNGNRRESYSISEIISLTKGEWGNEVFKSFFNK